MVFVCEDDYVGGVSFLWAWVISAGWSVFVGVGSLVGTGSWLGGLAFGGFDPRVSLVFVVW